MLTAVRVGTLAQVEWSDFEGDERHISADKMKMKRPHVVALSDWALKTLAEIRDL